VRHKRAVIFFISATGVYFFTAFANPFSWLSDRAQEVLKHAIGALAVVSLVHILDRYWFAKDLEQQFRDIKDNFDAMRNNLVSQIGEESQRTEKRLELARGDLRASSDSLKAMNEKGMLRIYSSRAQAAADIRDDLLAPNVTQILIIGISLNDFIGRAPNTALHEAWLKIKHAVEGSKDTTHTENLDTRQKKLDVKILIIDHECFGARLREEGENRNRDLAGASQLKSDLESTTGEISGLLELAERNGNRTVTLDCRFYRLAPQLFLCWTDQVCYVQPYHFWSGRDLKTSIPVFKYLALPESSDQVHRMHMEMKEHFDWIWENATVSFQERDLIRGIDGGILQTGAVNFFTDPALARERMLALLNGNPKEVDIQGITLRSFFEHRKTLQTSLFALFENPDVNVRLLVLDPDCEQAMCRSYKEYQLEPGPHMEFAKYSVDPNAKMRSTLHQHAQGTITYFENHVKILAGRHAEKKEQPRTGKVEMRRYTSSPACFIMRVDDTVLVEQYVYGKVEPTRSARKETLGEDMPLFEFNRDAVQNLIRGPTPGRTFYPDLGKRNPYNLLADHFEFAWRLAKRVASFSPPPPNMPQSVGDSSGQTSKQGA